MRHGFRFRLQRVLELRERIEEESARGLTEAQQVADDARVTREDLEVAHETGRTRLAQAHGAGHAVGHLQNLAYVIDRFEDRIHHAAAACREAEEHVVEKLASYREAFKQRKSIEELRGRKLDQWRTDEARAEQKTLDEVALVRHHRAEGQ